MHRVDMHVFRYALSNTCHVPTSVGEYANLEAKQTCRIV